ncbi:hypothetical protein [Winogradskya humida]|uniref:hypothetical protein n=1 Tax=Winogradskya humida TaxID=113566 RepID=UPI0019420FC1|nr:hypothetical protein [Actinoplanes humidus]
MTCVVALVLGHRQIITAQHGDIDAQITARSPSSEGSDVADDLFALRPVTWPATIAEPRSTSAI